MSFRPQLCASTMASCPARSAYLSCRRCGRANAASSSAWAEAAMCSVHWPSRRRGRLGARVLQCSLPTAFLRGRCRATSSSHRTCGAALRTSSRWRQETGATAPPASSRAFRAAPKVSLPARQGASPRVTDRPAVPQALPFCSWCRNPKCNLLVAESGDAIDGHMRMIGMIRDEGLDEHQQKLIDEKRREFENQSQAAISNTEEDSTPTFPPGSRLCLKCQTKAVVLLDGCMTCLNCGDSKCG